VKHWFSGVNGLLRLQSKEIQPYLHQCLEVDIDAVNLLILEQLKRCSTSVDGIQFLKDNNHFHYLSKFLLGTYIGASECSEHILVNFASVSPLGISLLFDEGLITSLKEKAVELQREGNMTLFFRILNVFTLIATQNPQAFTLCKELSCLQLIIDQLRLDDVVELLNSIDLIEKLSMKLHGLQYIITSGILNKLLDIVKSEDDGAGGLVAEKIIQLFGNILRQGEDSSNAVLNLPLLSVLSAKLDDSKHEISIISLLGALGRSVVGLKLLSQNLVLIENISSYLNSSVTDTNACVLGAFSEMFDKRFSFTPEEISLMELVYNNISTDPTTSQVLMEFLKKPFYVLRKASYSLLYSISQYTWGITSIATTPGLIELLLNRQAEIEIEGFTWKFSIFQRMIENKESKTILGLQLYYDVLQYVKCGIIYVPAQSVPVVKEEVF